MSNASSRAGSASRKFKEVQDAAGDPATMKLAQGLRLLADAIHDLARDHEQTQYMIQTIKNQG